MAGLFLWTASRTLLKVLVKFVIFFLNCCFIGTCECLQARNAEKRKLRTRQNQKKMYTSDLLQIVGNQRYNPISDAAFDIDKYSKLCAGIMFVCEGEVLLLQRNSNNNDLTFDLPGGTLDNEDFQQYHNSLLSRKEYKQRLKQAHKDAKNIAHRTLDHVENAIENVQNKFTNFTNPEPEPILLQPPSSTTITNNNDTNNNNDSNNNDSNNTNNNDDEPLHPSKRVIFPQVPLYDSFYFADIFSSEFQYLGLNAWQQKGQLKRKQLDRLYEQSIRHMKHGFGFDSGCWNGAVRETQEELNCFPTTITPLAIFNIYRGWSNMDSSSDDSDGDNNELSSESDFDVESQTLISKHDKELNGKKLNINANLLGNGKIIGENFRRYTLYLCSITPEQRNYLQRNINLSEEHTSWGFFPLCLLIPMQATTISTFRHFRIHPWLVAMIEQYANQFDKISKKTFWVGYNRHFPRTTTTTTTKLLTNKDNTTKNKKGNKKSTLNNNNNINDNDIAITINDETTTTTTITNTTTSDILNLNDDGDIKNNNNNDTDDSTNNNNNISKSEQQQSDFADIEDDNTNRDDDDADDDEDNTPTTTDEIQGKQKKGKKDKDKSKKKDKGKKNKDDSKNSQQQQHQQDINSSSSSDQDQEQPQQQYHDDNEITVEYDERDIFISVFLPLVKKHINPKVYI